MTEPRGAKLLLDANTAANYSILTGVGMVQLFSYPQSPKAHWRVILPIPSATMARVPEFSLYRLLRFKRTPFFRPRRSGRIRALPLHTPVRILNGAVPPRSEKLRLYELRL